MYGEIQDLMAYLSEAQLRQLKADINRRLANILWPKKKEDSKAIYDI